MIGSMEISGEALGNSAGVLAIGGLILWLFVHIVLAQSVANDVDRLRQAGREPRFMGKLGWAFIVLVTGVVGFALYWVMHHSSLRDPASDLKR